MDTKQYQMTYSQVGTQIFSLVVPPVALVGLMIWLLVRIARTAPDWLAITIIVVGVLGSIGATMYIFFRWANVPCTVSVGEEGVQVLLQRGTPLFANTHMHIGWPKVLNAAPDIDYNASKLFYVLKTQSPSRSILLTCADVDQFIDFIGTMQWHAQQYNANPTAGHQITEESFYGARWAKWFTVFVVVLTVIVTLFYILDPDIFRPTDVAVFYSLDATWLVGYYYNRRRSK